jgi:hypothetical protein
MLQRNICPISVQKISPLVQEGFTPIRNRTQCDFTDFALDPCRTATYIQSVRRP